MNMKIKLLFFFLLASMQLFAQATILQAKTKGLIYTQEKTMDLGLCPGGFALGFSKGYIKSYHTTPFWHAELGRLKHPKEYRQVSELVGTRGAKPFVYGKQNSFLIARLLRGKKKYLSEKARTKGVAVGWQYAGGLSLGLMKPYYLKLQYDFDPINPNSGKIRTEKYDEDTNRAVFLDSRSIIGAASFWTGIKETKVIPGIHARIGVLFDWGAFDENAKAVDVGVMVDVFPKPVPIMIDAKNYPFFLNLYINFQLGRRS